MASERIITACLTALWFVAAPAAAQTPAQKETARQLMDTGHQRLGSGDLQGALEAFRGADDIMHVPTTSLAVGKTSLELGMLLEATDALRRAARYPKRADEPDAFQKAREEAAQLDYQVAERIPALIVTVQGGAENPEVLVDGEKVPSDGIGLPYRVNPGQHVVEARAAGYRPEQSSVTVAEREKKQVVIQLAVDPNWKPPEEADAGGMPPWILPAVGFGVAGLGLTIGAITGGLSLSKTSALEEECGNAPCPESKQEDYDSIIALANASNVSFAIAGVGAIVGGIGMVLWLGEDDSADEDGADEAHIRPFVSPLGMGVTGSF